MAEMNDQNDGAAVEPVLAICAAAHDGDDAVLAALLGDGGGGGGGESGGSNGGEGGGGELVNRYDPVTGCTPLQHAVIGDHPDCVRVLLSHPHVDVNGHRSGIDLDALGSPKYYSPLLIAVFPERKHSLQIAKMLLDGGADINIVCGYARTAFIKACSVGFTDMVELLFRERKDDLLCANGWQTTDLRIPHYYAAAAGRLSILNILFAIDDAHNILLPAQDQYSIVEAAMRRQEDSLDILTLTFTRYASLYVETSYCIDLIALACGHGSVHVLQYLLEHGCKPYYVSEQSKELHELVLDMYHYQLSRISEETFGLIVRHIPPEIVRQHNERCASQRGSSDRKAYLHHPIELALSAFEKPFDAVLLLLKAGFDPAVVSIQMTLLRRENHSLLHRIDLIFRTGVVVNLSSVALAIARVHDNHQLCEVVSTLIKYGASVNGSALESEEISPLVVLSLKSFGHDYTGLCIDLIKAGADFNRRTRNSPYQCSDVVIAAALFGNLVVLSRAFASTAPVDAELLMRDILRFAREFGEESRWSLSVPTVRAHLKRDLFIAVGRSLHQVLKYVVKRNDDVRSSCVSIRDALAAQCTAFDAAAAEDIWRSILAEFDVIDRLQHLCRMQIRKQLFNSDVSHGEGFHQGVDSLQIPSFTKRYLTFAPEVVEFSEEGDAGQFNVLHSV